MLADADLAAAGAIDWGTLGLAFALLVASAALLMLEFFIVSFGLLLSLSVAAAAGAVYLAFTASSVAGFGLLALIPALGYWLTRWGVNRVRESRLVAQGEVTAEAGYHHHVDSIGAQIGAVGEMVTPARPSGRARFGGGECDVQARAGVLERGARVVVQEIDGPVVLVSLVEAAEGAASLASGSQREDEGSR